ncbi:hypothetical protein QAD02_005876 [Eretmocerus hayati]|uniref:Uncharacterized protein n=1 Tax=Eretmocerus hayati TaxID=131215 RepID=A0ACC2NWE2_9HYME|nr:hypothetical protein QAD02_005876 [Eretmocerus hayati]
MEEYLYIFVLPLRILKFRNAASWRLHFVYGGSCDVALEEPLRIAAKRSRRDYRGSPQSEASDFGTEVASIAGQTSVSGLECGRKSLDHPGTGMRKVLECRSHWTAEAIGMRTQVPGPHRHWNADVNKEGWPCHRETGMRM